MLMPLAARLSCRAAAAIPLIRIQPVSQLGLLASRLTLLPSSAVAQAPRASFSTPAHMRKAQGAPLGSSKISHFFQSSKRVPAPAEGAAAAQEASMPRAKPGDASAPASEEVAGPAVTSRRETEAGSAGAAKPDTRVIKGRNGEFLLKRNSPPPVLQKGPGTSQRLPPQQPSSSANPPYPPIPSLLRDESWKSAFAGELSKPYVAKLHEFLCQEAASGQQVFPPPHLVFNALNTCPLSRVRLVVIGQDPYHGPGQAMGLSFSVPRGVPPPSSLVNIFKELQADLGCPPPGHGDLTHWAQQLCGAAALLGTCAEARAALSVLSSCLCLHCVSRQGVLLLNTVLTVRRGQPNSHAKRGWETLTDAAIRAVVDHALGTSKGQAQIGKSGLVKKPAEPSGEGPEGEERGAKRARVEVGSSAKGPTPVVFLLWGAHAQSKARLLPQHQCIHVLKAPHPSGLSAHRGFFGCKHFSQANEVFMRSNVDGIEWAIPRN